MVGGDEGDESLFRLSRHRTARGCAVKTCLGTGLTVVHAVLFAFIRATLADVSAQSTYRCCMLASARHRSGRERAHLCAVNIDGNTFRHHLNVVFA
jgi:hypothetical protein